MLLLGDETFAAGRVKFLDDDAASEVSAKLYVPLQLGGVNILAQLDSGAPWSMVTAEVAEALHLLNGSGPEITLSTRTGECTGRLERVGVSLLATEGLSLDIEATIFVSGDWRGQNFIGWSGFLERIRFAVDPSQHAQHFYFGSLPA
jgi:hypothetical protein